jgi:hypothetical protein
MPNDTSQALGACSGASQGQRYRLRPIEVSALQWFPGVAIEGLTPCRRPGCGKDCGLEFLDGELFLPSPGDYVVTDSDGWRVVVSKESFERRYEVAP